jgi:mannose-1-phosphate guanylyltransferase/MurNAc alpha-1-phosphate uridylyltransferase
MADSLAGLAAVVLAAGAGERLRPLTHLRPKPLCPVANTALLDGALARVGAVVPAGSVAVNAHHHADQLRAHLADRPDVHLSVEPDRARGTAGALGLLRDWLDGRAVVVVNGDSWSGGSLAGLVADWDGERVRVLVHGDEPFGPRSPVVASLLPWSAVAPLGAEPSGLYEVCWRPAQVAGRLESVGDPAPFVDCGTPASYLLANRLAGPVTAPDAVVAAGATVVESTIGSGAVVEGDVRSSVVWPGAHVRPGERLDRAVRTAEGVTVLVR